MSANLHGRSAFSSAGRAILQHSHDTFMPAQPASTSGTPPAQSKPAAQTSVPSPHLYLQQMHQQQQQQLSPSPHHPSTNVAGTAGSDALQDASAMTDDSPREMQRVRRFPRGAYDGAAAVQLQTQGQTQTSAAAQTHIAQSHTTPTAQELYLEYVF